MKSNKLLVQNPRIWDVFMLGKCGHLTHLKLK